MISGPEHNAPPHGPKWDGGHWLWPPLCLVHATELINIKNHLVGFPLKKESQGRYGGRAGLWSTRLVAARDTRAVLRGAAGSHWKKSALSNDAGATESL